jgi:hypothetical protein
MRRPLKRKRESDHHPTFLAIPAEFTSRDVLL